MNLLKAAAWSVGIMIFGMSIIIALSTKGAVSAIAFIVAVFIGLTAYFYEEIKEKKDKNKNPTKED